MSRSSFLPHLPLLPLLTKINCTSTRSYPNDTLLEAEDEDESPWGVLASIEEPFGTSQAATTPPVDDSL